MEIGFIFLFQVIIVLSMPLHLLFVPLVSSSSSDDLTRNGCSFIMRKSSNEFIGENCDFDAAFDFQFGRLLGEIYGLGAHSSFDLVDFSANLSSPREKKHRYGGSISILKLVDFSKKFAIWALTSSLK